MRLDYFALHFDQSLIILALCSIFDGDAAIPDPVNCTLSISKLLYYPHTRVVYIQQVVLENESCNAGVSVFLLILNL